MPARVGHVTPTFYSIWHSGCVGATGYEWDLMGMSLAYASVVVLGLMVYFVKRMQSSKTSYEVLESLVLFTKIVLPAVSQTIAKALKCTSFDDGDYLFLEADYNIGQFGWNQLQDT